MNDKKYLDKVVGSLVRSTKINYDEEEIHTPFLLSSFYSSSSPFSLFSSFPSFTKYCKDIYGLTVDEVEYVWKEYRDNINDKIENGE
jgi:hypothetical protein